LVLSQIARIPDEAFEEFDTQPVDSAPLILTSREFKKILQSSARPQPQSAHALNGGFGAVPHPGTPETETFEGDGHEDVLGNAMPAERAPAGVAAAPAIADVITTTIVAPDNKPSHPRPMLMTGSVAAQLPHHRKNRGKPYEPLSSARDMIMGHAIQNPHRNTSPRSSTLPLPPFMHAPPPLASTLPLPTTAHNVQSSMSLGIASLTSSLKVRSYINDDAGAIHIHPLQGMNFMRITSTAVFNYFL
jgi:hypothetical protein